MKQLLLLSAGALVLTACQSPNSASPDRSADIAYLKNAKVQTWRALYRNQDAAGLAEFLHDDFIFITGNGEIIDKKNEVDYLANNEPNMAPDFLYTIKDIVFTGPNTAIIYGEGNSTSEDEAGKPCAHSYKSSNTLRRVGKDWKPVFSHVSGSNCSAIEE